MAKLGKFERAGQHAGEDAFKGTLHLVGGALPILIRRDEDATGERASDTFEVNAKIGEGWVNLGAAYRHSIKRGDNAGGVMFGLLIDHPEFPEMRASAFPHPAGGYLVKTDRKRPQAGGGSVDQSTGEVSDDDIPY